MRALRPANDVQLESRGIDGDVRHDLAPLLFDEALDERRHERRERLGEEAAVGEAEAAVHGVGRELQRHLAQVQLLLLDGRLLGLQHLLDRLPPVDQPLDDRPWAAFLYGSVGLTTATEYQSEKIGHVDELEFTLGVVGPEAMGKPVQRFVHKYLSDSPSPRGWKNQLDFEPGVVVSWRRRMPYAWHYSYDDLVHARIEPNFAISLGNVYTYAGTGATFILSSQKYQDTPPRVRPALPGTGVFADNTNLFDWQIFAGLDGRLIGRNIFLDGNTFSDSHSVDKKYLVGDANAGFSLVFGNTRLSYTLNARTKEFQSQSENSIFGSLTLTQKF